MSSPLDDAIHDPAAQPFLPLLFAAWDDGDLTTKELADLRSILAATEAGDVLVAWLDANHPPDAPAVAHLGQHVHEQFDQVGLRTPVELGTEYSSAAAAQLAEADLAAGPFGPARALPKNASAITLSPLPDPGPSDFDGEELSALLDGPHRVTKQRMRSILSQPQFQYRYDLSSEDYRELVFDWTQTLADEGIGLLGMPASVGGANDTGAFVAAFQTIAHHDLSLLTKFGVQFGLYGGAIMRLGTTQHHETYLNDAGTLATPGCFAMTETGHGSNVADLETTATFDRSADALVINTPRDLARKDYIGNAAAHGRSAVVFARLVVETADYGVHAVIVPIRDDSGRPMPGIRIEDNGHKAGLNGVDNGRIWFDNVRVPRSNLLDRFAHLDADGSYASEISSSSKRFFTTLGTLVGGRVSVGTAGISAAESALTIAVRYGTRRRQFGEPGQETMLLDYPSHQRRLLPRLATTYAYHFAFGELVASYIESEQDPATDRRELEGRAAGLKAFGTWHAMDTIQAAREACGGQGYLSVNRFGSLRSDADVFTTYEGDNTVLAQLLAKSLLTGYRSSFEDISPTRMARYISQRIGGLITEAVPGVGAIGNPTSSKSQRELLVRREHHSIETLALRIKARIDAGNHPAEAFVAVQPHTLHAARSHVEVLVFDAMDRAVSNCQDEKLSNLMSDVLSLYGLATIERDGAWFLRHGSLTANGAKDVRRAVDQLCSDLRPHARHLVDAFGITPEMLAAPIAV